jgi:thioredoxin 1
LKGVLEMVKHIHNGDLSDLSDYKPIIVEFTASWCEPCKRFAPTFERISEKHPEIEFIQLDVEEAVDMANAYGCRGVPFFVAFENKASKAIGSFSGVPTEQQLADIIENLIGENEIRIIIDGELR